MADKQKTEGLQIVLENGALEVETVHPKAGEVIKSNQLPGINWFFTQLAGRMGVKGKASVTELKASPLELFFDGDPETDIPESIVLPPQQIFVFCGKSKNGEETEFSHNNFLPGMPFELTVVTIKTVTARVKNGRKLVPETLQKPFGEDVRAAMRTAGIGDLDRVTAVSEMVRVLTLARVEWFPGIFEGSGTTYQISRIIRTETTRVVTFAGLTEQDIKTVSQEEKPVGDEKNLPYNFSQVPSIEFGNELSKNAEPSLDLDKLFLDMPELNPIIASQAVLIPVDELELSDQRPQLVKGLQGAPKPEPVEELEVNPEPEEEPKPELVEEPEVKPEPEEEPKFEPVEEPEFSVQDLQRMFDQLTSQVSEPIQEKIPETVWKPESVILQPEPVQEIPQSAVQLQTELQYTSPSQVPDGMIDDILGDLDVLMTESRIQSQSKRSLPATVETKAVHSFFGLGKKHK